METFIFRKTRLPVDEATQLKDKFIFDEYSINSTNGTVYETVLSRQNRSRAFYYVSTVYSNAEPAGIKIGNNNGTLAENSTVAYASGGYGLSYIAIGTFNLHFQVKLKSASGVKEVHCICIVF